MTTPRDPLAAALREALAAEPLSVSGDNALIARAIAGATAKLAAPATATEVASTSSSSSSSSTGSVPVLEVASRQRSRVVRIALPVAAAFAASIALASVYVSRQQGIVSPPARPVEAPAPAPTQVYTQNLPAEITSEPSVSVNDLPSAQPLAAVTTETVSFSPPPSATTAVTAAELFRDANAERRAGNIDKAVELYGALQKRFPSAAETQASRVSLGRLLLDRRGDANGALLQFNAYLKSATEDGTLAEEARVGRALALQQLGRKDEERRAWEELIARHPQSLHTSRARERLGALGATQ